jgi:hypothetical protein
MTKQAVQNMVQRAVRDAEFRAQLLNHPDQVLAGVDLTDAEAAQLRGLTSESLESLAIDLKHRAHRGEPPGTTDVPSG